jgi:hypothetical protein
VILLNISSLALSFGYRFKLHDKLKISLTSKYSVAPGEIALLLLGCALSRYLWEINVTVASVVIGVTSFGMIFYIFVIVAGTISVICPYQTPVPASSAISSATSSSYPLFVQPVLSSPISPLWLHPGFPGSLNVPIAVVWPSGCGSGRGRSGDPGTQYSLSPTSSVSSSFCLPSH